MKSPRDLAVSFSWNYIGRTADAAGYYGIGLIVAHAVGLREYGSYALILSGMQMVVTLSALGLETVLNRFLPTLAKEGKSSAIRFLLRRVILLRSVIAVALAFGVFFLLNLFRPFDGEASGLLVFALFATGRSLVPLIAMSMIAQLQTKVPSVVMSVVRLTEIVLVGALALNGRSLASFMLALAATSMLHAIALAVFARPRIAGPEEVIALRPILTFGGIYAINVAVEFVLSRYGDVVLLGIFDPDKSHIGPYEIGAGLVYAAGLVLTSGMGGVNFALFSELAGEGLEAHSTMRKFYQRVVRSVSALTIPLLMFLFVDAETVIGALYPVQFSGAASIVRAFAFVRIVARLFGGGENPESLLALGKVGLVTALGVVSACINLIGDIILIPAYGAWGAVCATSAAYLFVTCGNFLAVRRFLSVQLQVQTHLRLLGGCFVGAIVLLVIPGAPAVSTLALHLPLFIVATIATWTITKPMLASDVDLAGRVRESFGLNFRIFSRDDA